MIQPFVSFPERDFSSDDRICLVWSEKSASDRCAEVYALVHRLFNDKSCIPHSLVYRIAEDLCRLSAGLLEVVDEKQWDHARSLLPHLLVLVLNCIEAQPEWKQRIEVDLIQRKLKAIRSWIN